MDTDSLISRIAADSTPVRRLPPPWRRTLVWFLLALPTLILVLAMHGLDVSLAEILADRRFVIEEIATLATAIAAAMAAFASTIPGTNRKWLLLPAVPFAVWLLSVGEGCLNDFQKYGWDGLSLRIDSGCFLPMAVTSIVPIVAMVRMLSRGAPLTPRISMILGMLATAALVNFGLRLFHLGDVTFMVLVWHFGLVTIYAIGAGLLAHRILDWQRLSARLPASLRMG